MKRKPPITNVIVIVFTGLLATLGGILSSLASNALPASITPFLRFIWSLLGFVTLAIIVLTVWQYLLQTSNENTSKERDNSNPVGQERSTPSQVSAQFDN